MREEECGCRSKEDYQFSTIKDENWNLIREGEPFSHSETVRVCFVCFNFPRLNWAIIYEFNMSEGKRVQFINKTLNWMKISADLSDIAWVNFKEIALIAVSDFHNSSEFAFLVRSESCFIGDGNDWS